MVEYDKQEWLNGPEGGTPLSGARMTHIELGVGSSLQVPHGVKEGDILRKTDVGWEPVPADAYLSNSAVVIRGILNSPTLLPHSGQGGDGYLVETEEGYDLYIWVHPEWLNTGPMNNIQGPPGIRGVQGPPGAGLRVMGRRDYYEDLLTIEAELGDAYLIDEEMWIWDGESWNNTGNVGMFQHSALSGLDEDDHPQYAFAEGMRTVSVSPVEPDHPIANDLWGKTSPTPQIFNWDEQEQKWAPLAPPVNSTTYVHGLLSHLPEANPSLQGQWFWAVDVAEIYYCDGFSWTRISGMVRHSEVQGLENDDHPQYLTTERGDDRYVQLDGSKMDGILHVPNIRYDVANAPSSGTVQLDFDGPALIRQGPLTGTVTYSGINYGSGKTVTVRVVAGSTDRAVRFPSQWTFVGIKPTSLRANSTGVLTVTCFDSNASSCVAAWAFQL